MLFLTCRRASENVDCYTKISNNKTIKSCLGLPQGGNVFFKAKLRETQNNFFSSCDQVKNNVAYLRGIQKHLYIFNVGLFLAMYFEVKERYLQICN